MLYIVYNLTVLYLLDLKCLSSKIWCVEVVHMTFDLFKTPDALELKNSLHLHRICILFIIKYLQIRQEQNGEP